jgi:hypothetical protein
MAAKAETKLLITSRSLFTQFHECSIRTKDLNDYKEVDNTNLVRQDLATALPEISNSDFLQIGVPGKTFSQEDSHFMGLMTLTTKFIWLFGNQDAKEIIFKSIMFFNRDSSILIKS